MRRRIYQLGSRHLPAPLFAVLLLASTLSAGEPWSPYREQPRHGVPEWARSGKLRYGLWYGGPLDTGKGILSNWPYFATGDPDMLQAAVNWYTPETVEHIRAMHLSTAWLCWSNGFSVEQEEIQWRQLEKYVALLHQAGVRATGYMSIGNMFWKDMFAHVPPSKHWVRRNQEGDYQTYGRAPTRYMADINNPEWQQYLRRRIDTALAAGMDSLVYDNTLDFYGREDSGRVAAQMLAHARTRKPDVLFASNYNTGQLTWGRAQNMITSEEGSAPGFYETDPLPDTPYVYRHDGQGSFAKFGSQAVAFRGRTFHLVNNAGLARYLQGVGEGWRPVIIEHAAWNGRNRQAALLEPRRYQLAIAESAAFGFGFEIQFLGHFQRDLYFRRPEAMRCRDAIGRYNGFWARNEALFTGPESLASTALLLEDNDRHIPLLNHLAANSLLFDVLFEKTVTPEQLAHYKLIVLPGERQVPERVEAWLRDYTARGGSLHRSGAASRETVLEAIRRQDPAPALRFDTGAPVLANLVRQPERNRSVLHLVNYSDAPLGELSVLVRGKVTAATLHSPDANAGAARVEPAPAGYTRITVPRLDLYDIITLE